MSFYGSVPLLPANRFLTITYSSNLHPSVNSYSYTDGVAFSSASAHSLTMIVGTSEKHTMTVTNTSFLSTAVGFKNDGTYAVLAYDSQSFANLDISDCQAVILTKAANGGTGNLTITIS